LTNGSLLFRQDVADDACRADILAPSLDAGDRETFQAVNRPRHDLDFDKVWRGLRDVTHRFEGTVRLEVMLVRGINDSDESLGRIAERLEALRVDAIDINTPVRPVAGGREMICSVERLERARELFGPKAQVIPSPEKLYAAEDGGEATKNVERVAEILKRRPCTAAELGGALGLSRAEVSKALSVLAGRGELEERPGEKETYFFVAGSPE
jgi:wyosine [tRNA(Phe)-imidazoG37] synthetase (radical SAM superfamily)